MKSFIENKIYTTYKSANLWYEDTNSEFTQNETIVGHTKKVAHNIRMWNFGFHHSRDENFPL